MGAPEGNTNAEGNIGGRRKSAYQEMADAEALHEMFFGQQDKIEILEKIKKGKYSLKDILISKAFGGNEKILVAIFKKIFPDSLNIGGQAGNPLRTLTDEEIEQRIKQYKDSLSKPSGGTNKKESPG